MDLQIREAVEIYGSTKYISTENLLSAVLDSKKIGKILGKYEDFRNPQEIAEYLMPKLRYLEKEEFIVCSLNSKNKMTHYEVLFTGTLTNTIVHPREIYYEAIKNKAASIVVVHNHPSGDPSPSMDDNKLTKVLKETGKIMGIPLLDHLIIGNEAYYSYAETDIDNW